MLGGSGRSNRTGQEMPPLMYNLPEITEPVERLERLVRKEKDAQIQRRFHMLLGCVPEFLDQLTG